MTKKLLHFHTYRSSIYHKPYDPRWCAAAVYGDRAGSHQCGRAPKLEYGGHKWCAQHHPPAIAERQRKRNEKWRREAAESDAKYKRAEDARRQRDAALEAIKKIAGGHNDPVSLAREVLGLA